MSESGASRSASKRCKVRGEIKLPEEFYANPTGRAGLRPECKDCTKGKRRASYLWSREQEIERVRQWALANPAKVQKRIALMRGSDKKRLADRKSYLKRKYALTIQEYDAMLAAQNGVCAICNRPRPENRTLHVDHDHGSGEIRGLLCFRCNNALGDFEEQYELFQRAANYLDRDDELAAIARGRAKALSR
jgi:hypothetical protein